jgi:CHAT domain-containing protein
MAPIPEVKEEIKAVTKILMSASAIVINDASSAPKAETILEYVPATHILHLACHGQQDSDPLKSHFVLDDGPLSISALMNLNLPNAMLAFLSACETAKGDKYQPDQVVHLAASMLFCGFRSVIATMWQVVCCIEGYED